MQSNTITLAVDTANSGSPTNKIYSRYTERENASVYIGASHTLSMRDQIQFSRSFPTQSGNYLGVMQSTIKLTADVSVLGADSETTLVKPAIVNLQFNIPVGTASATILELRQRLIAVLDDDTIMTSLNEKLEI
jgi:hypothetical protein